MKRPVILLFVASLLASGSVLAKSDKPSLTDKVASKIANDKRDHQGHDGRNDHRNHDRGNQGRDHGRTHDRRDNNDRRDWDRGHDRRDHRRDHRQDHRQDRRRDHRNDHRGWDRHRNDWHRHPNYWDNRRNDRRDYARHRFHFGHYHAPRGYYHRVWHRGDRLPRAWYGNSYVVYDYRPYRLYSPPYGYHWVRVGNDVLLTAIATGIVLDVLYDIWY
jgi:Ni/Co efflux regulator RcnB